MTPGWRRCRPCWKRGTPESRGATRSPTCSSAPSIRPPDPNSKWTSKYDDLPIGPLLPSGFGLSYTTFQVSGMTISATAMPVRSLQRGSQLRVSATVKDTGTRARDEVVQLYVHNVAASIVQPVRRLRGFRRVNLSPGQSAALTFRLGAEDLGFWSNDSVGRFVVEPGRFELVVATDAEDPGLSSKLHADQLSASPGTRTSARAERVNLAVPGVPARSDSH